MTLHTGTKMIKINILSIAISGFLMMMAGILMYYYKGSISEHIRFFLPIPPITVASYVFVFNVFRHYDGHLPADNWKLIYEIFYATVISTTVFFFFAITLVLLVRFFCNVE